MGLGTFGMRDLGSRLYALTAKDLLAVVVVAAQGKAMRARNPSPNSKTVGCEERAEVFVPIFSVLLQDDPVG
eukprot:6394688-Amphidinium_carterae.1